MILLSNHTYSFKHLITKMVVIVNVNPCDLHDYGHVEHMILDINTLSFYVSF